jgi:hypothetical protein
MSNNSETQYNRRSNSNNDSHSTNKPSTRKPGRTLIVKSSNEIDSSFLDTLTGFQSKFYASKSLSYFVTFSTPEEALDGLRLVKKQYGMDVRVKFAHYRVYFTMLGLTETSDYNTVKTTHSNFVTKVAGCNVLYYRLYRKNDNYIGCGDFTVDTKEGFDVLMNQELFKNFTLDDTTTGVHYRYNKTKTPTSNARFAEL